MCFNIPGPALSRDIANKPILSFVILPDIPGCSRPATRPKHLKRAAEMPGFFRMGGAYLEKHPETPEEATDEKLKFQGSAMLVVAESEEDVMEKLKVDPYVVEGVWDLSKARIWHFKTAVSQPLSASKPPF